MKDRETLLVPQPNLWQFRIIFGGLFLAISILGIYYSIRGILKFGLSWDCYSNAFVALFVISLLAIFVQRTHEFQRQSQSLTTYWALGLPVKNLFTKLPIIWRAYPSKRVSKLKVYRISRVDSDDYSGRTKIITYHIKAKLSRKMIYLVHYNNLQKALITAWEIGEFLDVQVDESNL